MQDTRVYRSAVINVKSKDHQLVVSRVNLKLKIWKTNYILGSYNFDRRKDENLREISLEQLNTKLESLKFDNVEVCCNNSRKTNCEIADGVLGKIVRTVARNIRGKPLYAIERKRGLYKNYLSDRSYEKAM